MRHALHLTMLILAMSCATRARAAGPHAFDPDGPRPAPQRRVTPQPVPPIRSTAATQAPTASTHTPARVVRPAPSVGLEPPPPPGMNILRHMMRHSVVSPGPLDRRRDALTPPRLVERWVL